MKKPRLVSIPESRQLSQKDYLDLSEHARKSAIFYATRRSRSSGEIREKLLAKGYVEENIEIVSNEDTSTIVDTVNIIEDTLAALEDSLLLDDEELASNISESYQNKGRGKREIERKLRDRKIEPSLIEKTLNEINEEDLLEGVRYSAELYTRKSAYANEENPYKQKQKLYAHLTRRGFDINIINAYMEELDEQ